MRQYPRLLLAALALFLSACNSSTDTDDSGNNNNPSVAEGKVTWKVDGETVIIDGFPAIYNPSDEVISVGGLSHSPKTVQMNLMIYAPGEGEFPIRTGNTDDPGTSFATGNHNGTSFAAVKGSGKVTFTSYTNTRVIGRFSFRAISALSTTDTLEITDGEFNIGRLR